MGVCGNNNCCRLFWCVEIVDRVALGEWPYLRPSLNTQSHSEELGLLMQRCWAEEPSDRPEFNHISLLLRKQNRSVFSHSLCHVVFSRSKSHVTVLLAHGKSWFFCHYTTLFHLLPASDSFHSFVLYANLSFSSKDDLTFIVHFFLLLTSGSTEVTSWTIFCPAWSSTPITWRSW